MRTGLGVFLVGIVLSAFLPLRQPERPPTPTPPTDDGRAATVLDQQGTAQVRPLGRHRWSPLGPRTPLAPGDLVRTSPRGANAVEIEVEGGRVVLGPGAQMEIGAKGVLRLVAGEVEVAPRSGNTLRVIGPAEGTRTLDARTVLRAADQRLDALTADPRWLVGYRGSTTQEWLGSLITQVDGRDVPLHVGYHKVTVEIRDQIARTTVEQSFVNSTASRLEGTFLFPLPAEASVSGFGMWIGDELVEADIVEKQRARAIFEQILRERRDPGLLEWAGGNLFKARVFPIEPRSEKRVRIRYTQVLPLQGDEIVYRYALRSELLRSRPLRQLAVDVSVASATAIADVTSPTHAMRLQHTAHAARAEFDAQQYAPDRDLEVRVKLDNPPPLTLLPHRRGDDGYFALMFRAPGDDGGRWQRELVPDGAPLDLVLLADTSASMDQAARAAQSAFLDALLGLLSEKDRFQLIACDVDAQPLQPASSVTAPAVARALSALSRRASLGWTDLDRAFAAAGNAAAAGCVVVYVGDGIGTARGDSNPAVLARRLAELPAAARHMVTVSSTYEQGVLAALAGKGGSIRSAAQAPARAAFDLLAEVARPPLANLRLRFEGLRTARVHPETLPNLAGGQQQIVVGRYLPSNAAQHGKVFVSGDRDGQPVEFSAEVELPADDGGNAFLPRLWARRQVDALLAQGDAAKVKDDVIALSEEFTIMTPLTSLLVLESDADRERFGVARRVHMRDGEQFFADGRDRARTELQRAQMQRARAWRLDLRTRLLAELAAMGDDLYGWHVALSVSGGRQRFAGGGPFDFATSSLVASDAGKASDRLGFGDDSRDDSSPEAEDEDAATAPAVDDGEAPAETANAAVSQLSDARAASRGLWSGRREAQEKTNYRGAFSRPDRGHASYAFAFPFPALGPAPQVATPATSTWPDEVVMALRAASLRAAVTAASTGLVIESDSEDLHPLRQHVVRAEDLRLIVAGGAWLVDAGQLTDQRRREWTLAGERGCAWLGFGVGRHRPAGATDAEPSIWPFVAVDADPAQLAHMQAEVVERNGDALVIGLRPAQGDWRLVLVVDTARRVVLERRTETAGKVTSRVLMADFVSAGGRLWPTRATTRDGDGRITRQSRFSVRELPLADAKTQIATGVAECAAFVMLPAEDPGIEASKVALAERRAGVEHHLVLAAHYASSQQWEPAFAAFAAVETSAPASVGLPWLRLALLVHSRRGDELMAALSKSIDRVERSAARERGFLAARVLGQTPLHAQEKLAWLDRLADALERDGAAQTFRRCVYHEQRAVALGELGRWAEVVDERTRLLALLGNDLNQVLALVAARINAGQRQQALADLAEVSTWPGGLERFECLPLYDRWTDLLWQERDLPRLLEVCAQWTAAAPGEEQAHVRWLSVLLFAGRERDVDAWLNARFDERVAAGDPGQVARLGAAMQLALGSGWQFYRHHLDDRYAAPLAALVQRLCNSDAPDLDLATRALSHWQFVRSDAGEGCRRALARRLATAAAIETMPLPRLLLHLRWVEWSEQQDSLLAEVKARVRARFSTLTDDGDRERLGQAFLTLASARGHDPDALAFLRGWLECASAAQTPSVARRLLEALEQEPWTEAIEKELLALAPRTVRQVDGEPVLDDVAGCSRELARALLTMRERARLGPEADLETLPRAARRAKEAEAHRFAQRDLAASLTAAAAAAPPVWRPWLQVEALVLTARTTTQPHVADGEARELLAASTPDAGWTSLLRERCALVIGYLATRRSAPADLGEAALRLCRDKLAAADTSVLWRIHLLRLLIVLDRHDEVVETLRTWIAAAAVDSQWRVALGYFLAEGGDLRGASQQLETVALRDELSPGEARQLADWYLALGDDAGRAAAQARALAATPEWELYRRLYRDQQRLTPREGVVPPALEPETLATMRALLHKATNPESYVWVVESLYRSTKDFRVLTAFADGMLGHTPQRIYPLLQRAFAVVAEVHEEATSDALRAHIAELRAQNTAPSDQRVLCFLELAVERRAAMVRNQPGPHAERALACLQAAAKLSWLPGEPLQVAQLLASLGAIEDAALAAEQQRQLRLLYEGNPPRTADGLQIAQAWFSTVWAYGRHDQAIDGLGAALDEFRQTRAGDLGVEANPACDLVVGYLTQRDRFAEAETFLRGELERQRDADQQDHFTLQLFSVACACMARDGSMSFGRGDALYRGAMAAMRRSLFGCRADHVRALHEFLLTLHRQAVPPRVATSGDDLSEWAHGGLFEVASRVPDQSSQLFAQTAEVLTELTGPRAGVALLVVRLEKEPGFLGWTGQGAWQAFAHRLGQWRESGRLEAALEQRLLQLVLAELERDLTSGEQRGRAMYGRGSYFWSEQLAEFLAVAERVAARRRDSSAGLLWVADYLASNLDDNTRALTVLRDGEARRVLRSDARARFVDLLLRVGHAAEAVPVARALVATEPDVLGHRCVLARALHGAGDDAAAATVLRQAEARVRTQKLVTPSTLAEVAQAALDCGLHAHAVALYTELVPLHQRQRAHHGQTDATLAAYYGNWARALVALARYDEAVDTAAAGVVAWGRRIEDQRSALQTVDAVLAQIEDLDAYVGRWAARVEASGRDAPVLRKAIAHVYLARRAYERGIEQLQAARALQPLDDDVHRELLQAFAAKGDLGGEIAALAAWAQAFPLRIDTYAELGARLEQQHDANAERAWTSTVEVLPDEALGHRRLAEHRRKQARYADEVVHRRRVTEIRSDEPEGWFLLAQAQVDAGTRAAAETTLRHLRDGTWDARFGDVRALAQARLDALSPPGSPR